MTGRESQSFCLGDWLVEPDAGRVSRSGESATLRPREMDLLVYFARHPGEVLPTDDIISNVWSGVHVTNDSLYFSISQLRKALDDGSGAESVIETLPKRGYRLTAEVTPIAADVAPVDQRAVSEAQTSGTALPPTAVSSARDPDAPVDDVAAPSGNGVAPTSVRRQRVAQVSAIALLVLAALAWFLTSGDNVSPEPSPAAALPYVAEADSIAVMPFIDLTPEADYTYFSDGITEEILNRLTRVPGLRVAARTSSFTFKDSDADVIEIGRSLGVTNLLEGSVRKEGDRVRVSVQLIDAETGFQRWSESYDRQLTSVFQIQNDISRKVTDALEMTLGGGGDKADRPASGSVLDEYLLGLEALRAQTFTSLTKAADHFRYVLEQDPSFSNARVQLAATYLEQLNTGSVSDLTRAEDAESLLQTVLAEQPDNASAHRVMGIAQKWLGKHEEARRELDIALQLAPSDSEAMTQLAHLESFEGDVLESRRLLTRALRLDPFSNYVLHSYAVTARQFGAIDDAEEALSRAVDLHGENPNAAWALGTLQVRDQGHLARGLDNFLVAAELDPADHEIAAYVAATYLTLGLPDAAAPWIRRAEQDGPGTSTTMALAAIAQALDGRASSAAEISLDALEHSSYRIHAHSPITRAFLALAVAGILDRDDVPASVARLESLAPGKRAMPDRVPARDDLDAILAFSDFSRQWLVSLATAYKAAGMDEKLASAMERLALTRIDTLGAFRDNLRNDDYLLEAEARALEGDIDGAFGMLHRAVEGNHLYLWQVTYALNPALGSLRSDPRWDELMARIRARVEDERLLLPATAGVTTAYRAN